VQKLQKACIHGRSRIGNREVVGFGYNGQYSYQDRVDFPMPAIRFKENTPDIVVSTTVLNVGGLRTSCYLCNLKVFYSYKSQVVIFCMYLYMHIFKVCGN
jgi:hypothetical protein